MRGLPAFPTALIVAACLLVAAPARADIVIGVAAPLSGEFAPLGAQMRDGAARAIADINAAGGVNGEMLKLEAVDDACVARKADAAANQLAAKGAVMVVGHLCLKASIAGAAVYAAEHIVQISPATTFGGFTDNRPGPGIFRLCGRDDAEGAFAGAALAARYAVSGNLAVIDDRTTYGKTLADAAAAALASGGRADAHRSAYDPGAKDYAGVVSRLEADSIDAVYVGGSAADAAAIAREMKARGMATVLVGSSVLLDPDFGDGAGDAAEGTLVTYPADTRKIPAASSVVAEFAKTNVDPVGYTLPAYAAVEVWAAAAKAAGATDFDKVVHSLAGDTFHTVIGDVSFDEKGDMRNPRYDWYVWRGGAYAPAGM